MNELSPDNAKAMHDRVREEMLDSYDEEMELELDEDRIDQMADEMGGEKLTSGALGKGWFHAPTVFGDANAKMRLAAEEIFREVWGDERILDAALKNRVRVAMTTLRNLGLGEHLARYELGYSLTPAIEIFVVEDADASEVR